MKTLLLWDIDGTLINSGGAGLRALQKALQAVFGVEHSLVGIEFAGRTDRWIVREIFAQCGLAATEENFILFFAGYVAALPFELPNPRARILPGVRDLLEQAASRPDLSQGLLTGNLRRTAEAKLVFHGLWSYFAFGAFADDSEHRNDLAAHALRRAEAHANAKFSADRIWVIGDTPYDIACGRAIGAKTLAVATGQHTSEQLLAHAPTALLSDLHDHDAFFSLLEK